MIQPCPRRLRRVGGLDRFLEWDGCYNVRDLGGLRTAGGGTTRFGAVVRSDGPAKLTADGWRALWAYGIRTVVDLTEESERRADLSSRPAGLVEVHVPLDGDEEEFWGPLRENGHWGTALYYAAFLERYPHRIAAAVTAVAAAGPGGVLVHCGRGRDRTGLISLMLLGLVGVGADEVFADYQLSDCDRVIEGRLRLGLHDDTTRIAEIYAEVGATEHDTIHALLGSLDAATYLRAAGVTDDHLAAVHARLNGG